MIAADHLTEYYAPLLDDTYDVVDRIVIRGYNTFASSAGGFRLWWHDLHGTCDQLDDTHLMRMAMSGLGAYSPRGGVWGGGMLYRSMHA